MASAQYKGYLTTYPSINPSIHPFHPTGRVEQPLFKHILIPLSLHPSITPPIMQHTREGHPTVHLFFHLPATSHYYSPPTAIYHSTNHQSDITIHSLQSFISYLSLVVPYYHHSPLPTTHYLSPLAGTYC